MGHFQTIDNLGNTVQGEFPDSPILPIEVAVVSGGSGGGGSSTDRELVVSTYTVKTAFTGASVGDTITATQIIDVTGAASTVSTIWRNQTTAADLGSAPTGTNLTLVGSQALTDAQLRANPIGTRTYAAAIARVAVAAATAPSVAITATEVLVHASTRCFIATGAAPVATTNDIPLEAGEKFHLRITSGHKIAVIRDTADGFLNIVPVA